jgi:two-component system, OmpR family, sensor histidine kinase PhoQ
MNPARSIRARLVIGAALVLTGFMAIAGYAVQRAHSDSVQAAQFARLQATVYLLVAAAELNPDGTLAMPEEYPEPRLSLPGSGLYARVSNTQRQEEWRSASSVAVNVPFPAPAAVGQWHFDVVRGAGGSFLAATYTVKWNVGGLEAPLAISVLEDKRPFDREVATFVRILWTWLGGACVLLLLSQTFLLEWALSPLRRVAREVQRVEDAQQPQIEGTYPVEITALTGNINALIERERSRQTRYKEALSFLAHSLKTPLAVLRASTGEPAQLPGVVAEQVARMDGIVQHQLARAVAGAGALFLPPLRLHDVLQRIRTSLEKVYAGKGLSLEIECDSALMWRIDEGEAFELLGNLMDNASKWAKSRVVVHVAVERGELQVRVEDDGPGFGDTESVLKLHVRGDEQVPGHGVGLAVVNEIVASHDGKLDLSRSTLGGAHVAVTLRAD